MVDEDSHQESHSTDLSVSVKKVIQQFYCLLHFLVLTEDKGI